MRLSKLSLRGITTYLNRVDVDFDLAGAGLLAVVGPNGAGKSTLLDAVPAALYKTFPSRPGHLYNHCHGTDAFIEATFIDDVGARVRVLLQINAEKGTTESYIFVNDRPLTSGRAVEFAAEVKAAFGTERLLLASAFAAQDKAGNFLLMPKGDRKGLFVELLGIGHLEALAKVAAGSNTRAERQVDVLRRLLATADERLLGLPQARQTLTLAKEVVADADVRVQALSDAETLAIRAVEEARALDGKLAGLRSALGSASMAHDEAKGALQRAQKARFDADRADERMKQRHADAVKKLDERESYLRARAADRQACEAAVREVEELEAEEKTLTAAAHEHARIDYDLALIEGRLTLARTNVMAAQSQRKAWRERLENDAALLRQVPCTEVEGWRRDGSELYVPLGAICPLLKAAQGSAKTLLEQGDLEGPEVIDAAKEMVAIEEEQRKATEAEAAALALCDPLRLAEITEGLLAAARKRAAGLEVAQESERQLDSIAAERTRLLAAHEKEAADAQASWKRLTDEEERARRAVVSAEAARGKAALAYDEARGATAPNVPQAEAALSEARQARKNGQDDLRVAEGNQATAAAAVTQLEELEARSAGERADLRAAERDLADWLLLERALGKDGIQALEIDAAGPEVAKLTNDLLEACWGAKFTIAFETLREKVSEKGAFTEVFDVRVFDEGQERQVEALSGGEKVIVGEAVGLALAIFNSRRSGVRWRTLFRDETAGALYPETATAYVDMLRRAMALGGFEQVVFVTHQPELWERADARLVVKDGRVTLDAPNRVEAA